MRTTRTNVKLMFSEFETKVAEILAKKLSKMDQAESWTNCPSSCLGAV
jgi:hypothetical protein